MKRIIHQSFSIKTSLRSLVKRSVFFGCSTGAALVNQQVKNFAEIDVKSVLINCDADRCQVCSLRSRSSLFAEIDLF